METRDPTVLIILGLFSLASTVFTGVVTYFVARLNTRQNVAENKATIRDDKTDNRVDLMWKAHLRRGESEAKQKQLAVETHKDGDKVITLVPDVRQAYNPIAPFLKDLRQRFPDPVQFTEEVETHYGDWLSKHICNVLGVSEYACLAMAVSVSEEKGSNDHLEKLTIMDVSK